jgi:hypothetical protein
MLGDEALTTCCLLQAAKLLKVADDGSPYPAPAATRPNEATVHSAAAKVKTIDNKLLLDGKPPHVTYEPELKHTKWRFPPNAARAQAAAEPDVSPPMPYDGRIPDPSASFRLERCLGNDTCDPSHRHAATPHLRRVRDQRTALCKGCCGLQTGRPASRLTCSSTLGLAPPG